MATAAQMLAHAREFTNIEDQTLDLWLDLENAGLDTLAASLIDAGLMAEHFTSLMPSDTSLRTLEMVVEQQRLYFALADQVRLALAALAERGIGAGRRRQANLAVLLGRMRDLADEQRGG